MAGACLEQTKAEAVARSGGDLGDVTRPHGPRGHRGVLCGRGGHNTGGAPQGEDLHRLHTCVE